MIAVKCKTIVAHNNLRKSRLHFLRFCKTTFLETAVSCCAFQMPVRNTITEVSTSCSRPREGDKVEAEIVLKPRANFDWRLRRAIFDEFYQRSLSNYLY